jgi:2-amino-4-hydroxy-6-hydroxymethyldihydropteridine diphosphokinase
MAEVYLLLGSNLGDRLQHLDNAKALIAERCGAIAAQSAIYETAAWGNTEQQSFYNQAIGISTTLAPADLLVAVKAIEKEVGRVETVHWGPRIIDIDIILYGNEVVNQPQLQIPHPYMHQRRFTLAPLAEIGGSAVHPIFNKTVSELLAVCSDTSGVTKI